jgi:YgiT-type zinc finger domain-containing protein
MDEQVTDLPFKLSAHKILVVKQVPAHICGSCGETLLKDDVLVKIDEIIGRIQDFDSELEVVRYAA